VNAVKQQFKSKYIINILMGKITSNIKQSKHNRLDVFGKGSDHDEKFWNAVVKQTLIERLLTKDIENYGLLKLSPEGNEFLRSPHSIMLVDDHDFEKKRNCLRLWDQKAAQPIKPCSLC
jgi:ATP-dependent DNA helicase RecQ